MLNNYKSSIQPNYKTHTFSRVPKNDAVTYSTFDRSHRYLTAHDADYLIPILIDEVYPGDIFSLQGRHLVRLLTPIHPFMDRLRYKLFFFYCPDRITWNHTKEFWGERKRNDDAPAPTYQVPMLNTGSTGVEVGSIFDYAGIPVNVPNLEFSAMPFRAMNLIYNYFFRDENVGTWLNVGGTTGANGEYDLDSEFGDSDNINNYHLFKIAKSHDYFTSALPTQQLGEPVTIDISDNQNLPVYSNGQPLLFQDVTTSSGAPTGFNYMIHNTSNGNIGVNRGSGQTGMRMAMESQPAQSSLYAKLSGVQGFPISDFRTMLQLQAIKELSMRFGHRYKEYIKGHFNVTVSDATLDQPEYLGGYSLDINIIPVANTSGNSSDPQGNLAAFGATDTFTRHGFSKAFEEHGYVIGFAVAKSDQSYQQGLDKFWSRKNLYDFYDPLLANISEQDIKMRELFAQGNNVKDANGEPVDNKTFAYQEAWADLRFKNNKITGRMRSGANSLDVWHLAPQLKAQIDPETKENLGIPFNEEFIESDTPLDRVIAVPGTEEKPEPQLYSDNYFDYKCTREIPLYSVPAYLTGRF